MNLVVLTGFAAGTIHVITGLDHMIAIAPTCIEKPQKAIANGLKWGFGHSVGVIYLGLISIAIKDITHVDRISNFAELSVGIALFIVGVKAIKSSFGLNIHVHKHTHPEGSQHEHIHFHLRGQKKHSYHSHATTNWGILHGFAGASHLIAILPALALPPIIALLYFVFYLIGSTIAMSMAVLAISIFSSRANFRSTSLFMGMIGGLSIATGVFWIGQSYANLT